MHPLWTTQYLCGKEPLLSAGLDLIMRWKRKYDWAEMCSFAKLCPVPFLLKLEFGNYFKFAALSMSVKYSRSQTRCLLSELWKSTWGLKEVKGCCNGGARLHVQTKSTQSFLFLAKWNVKMYFVFPIFLFVRSTILNLMLFKNGTKCFIC